MYSLTLLPVFLIFITSHLFSILLISFFPFSRRNEGRRGSEEGKEAFLPLFLPASLLLFSFYSSLPSFDSTPFFRPSFLLPLFSLFVRCSDTNVSLPLLNMMPELWPMWSTEQVTGQWTIRILFSLYSILSFDEVIKHHFFSFNNTFSSHPNYTFNCQ